MPDTSRRLLLPALILVVLLIVAFLAVTVPSPSPSSNHVSPLLEHAFSPGCACIFGVHLGDSAATISRLMHADKWFWPQVSGYTATSNGVTITSHIALIAIMLQDDKVVDMQLNVTPQQADATLDDLTQKLGPPENYTPGRGTYTLIYTRLHLIVNTKYDENGSPRFGLAQHYDLTTSLPTQMPATFPRWTGW